MSKKVNELPTSTLISYQQVAGLANEQMNQFAEDLVELQKQKKVSQSFVEETHKIIGAKISKNNEILTELEEEIFHRMGRDLKGVTTPKIMNNLYEKYKQEAVRFAKPSKKKEKKKVDLKISE